MTRHDDESLLELARWTLGAVAGCAAPLWCRLVGHGPTMACNEGAGVQCLRCGDWWSV